MFHLGSHASYNFLGKMILTLPNYLTSPSTFDEVGPHIIVKPTSSYSSLYEETIYLNSRLRGFFLFQKEIHKKNWNPQLCESCIIGWL